VGLNIDPDAGKQVTQQHQEEGQLEESSNFLDLLKHLLEAVEQPIFCVKSLTEFIHLQDLEKLKHTPNLITCTIFRFAIGND
jgi:hypothetical protein